MSDQGDSEYIHFSLDDVSKQSRPKVWTDALNEFFYDYDFRLPPDFATGSLKGFRAGELRVASVHSDAMSVYRNSNHISHDALDSYFVLLHNGDKISLRQRGKEAFVENKQFALVSTGDPYAYVQNDTTMFNNIIIPGKFMRHFAPHVDEFVAENLPRTPVSAMFYELASSLSSNLDSIEKHSRDIIARQVVELLGLSFDGADHLSSAAPVRPGHRRRITRLIEKNYPNPSFNLEKISAALGLSKRYIQAIFAADGESVFDAIRRRRVAEACLLLRRVKSSRSMVTEIAFRVGFSNISHFSHVFKKETGHAPTDFSLEADDGE